MSNLSKEKMTEMMAEMLAMQEEVNNTVNPSWREAESPWYVAVDTELGELRDHVGWKWWKKQDMDLPQCVLEVADIWAFVLSNLLEGDMLKPGTWGRDSKLKDMAAKLVSEYEDAVRNSGDREPFTVLTKSQIFDRIDNYKITVLYDETATALFPFFRVMFSLGMDLQDLYKLYIGKSVLNKLRQDHGYKEGAYEKQWYVKRTDAFGVGVALSDDHNPTFVEDNVHLTEVVDQLEVGDDLEAYKYNVEMFLQERYERTMKVKLGLRDDVC